MNHSLALSTVVPVDGKKVQPLPCECSLTADPVGPCVVGDEEAFHLRGILLFNAMY